MTKARDRVAVKWPIRYERLLLDQWSEPKQALCINVSGEGMLLLLHEPLESDEFLRLHMRDANRNSPFTLAQVRWSKAAPADQPAPMIAGIEYVEVQDLTHFSAFSSS